MSTDKHLLSTVQSLESLAASPLSADQGAGWVNTESAMTAEQQQAAERPSQHSGLAG